MPVTPFRSHLKHATAVVAGFAVLGGAAVAAFPAAASAAPKSVTIKVDNNKTWGKILTEANGRTVYRFDADPKNKSDCSGSCAKVWPPVLASKVKAKGLKGFGEIKRANGQKQVTYKGIPLYTFIKDKPGQVNGNEKDSFGQWATINPSKPTATPVAKASGSGTQAPPTTAGGSSSLF